MKDSGQNGSMPYSEDAEKGVLCSLILSPREVADLCILRLQPEAFYNPIHRTIYETLLKWKGIGAVEFPWLKEEIRKRGKLEDAGGAEFLDELFRFVSTAANAQYYIDGVREQYVLRRLIDAIDKFRDEDIKAALADLEPEIHEIVHSSNGVSSLKGASLLNYSQRKVKDDDTLLGNRYLCRGVACLSSLPAVLEKVFWQFRPQSNSQSGVYRSASSRRVPCDH